MTYRKYILFIIYRFNININLYISSQYKSLKKIMLVHSYSIYINII